MAEHELKTWPPYFGLVRDGRKRFEIRRNDRGYAVGDILILREYDAAMEMYTEAQPIRMRVTCVTDWIQREGTVVLGIAPENEPDLRAALAAAEERCRVARRDLIDEKGRVANATDLLAEARRERDEAVKRHPPNDLYVLMVKQHAAATARVREMEDALRDFCARIPHPGGDNVPCRLNADPDTYCAICHFRALLRGEGKGDLGEPPPPESCPRCGWEWGATEPADADETLLFSLGPTAGAVMVFKTKDGYTIRGAHDETRDIVAVDPSVGIGTPCGLPAPRHGPSGVSKAIPCAEIGKPDPAHDGFGLRPGSDEGEPADAGEEECVVGGVRYIAHPMPSGDCDGCAGLGREICDEFGPCQPCTRKDERSVIWKPAHEKEE